MAGFVQYICVFMCIYMCISSFKPYNNQLGVLGRIVSIPKVRDLTLAEM